MYFPTQDLDTASREHSVVSVSVELNKTSAQDILADLGKPSRVFYKEEDKMKIHSVTDHGTIVDKSNPIESKTTNIAADDKDKGNS